MNIEHGKKNAGQVLVLIAIAFIALLGFTALAIDGGMIYSDRRQAQNAADAAALAGALQKAEGQLDTTAIAKAEEILVANHYDPSRAIIVVSNGTDSDGNYYQVQVDMSSATKMFFAQLFGFNQVENQVKAVAKTRGSLGGPLGASIIAMGQCPKKISPDSVDHLLNVNGGGTNGGIITIGGDIFLNSAGSDNCPIDFSEAPKSLGVQAVGGKIYTVGADDFVGESFIDPLPAITNANGGYPIGDPLEGLDEPVCNADGGEVSPGEYKPGNYGKDYVDFPSGGDITLQPGVYCIHQDNSHKGITMAASSTLTGDGVLLYLVDAGASFSGGSSLHLTAPTEDNCSGTAGSPSDICDYIGMVIFSARDNDSLIDFSGNGNVEVSGTVYALSGTVSADGGGSEPDEWVVRGQIIAKSLIGDGNGTFTVLYDDNWIYHGKPKISLTK